ncbi:MAG: hypothetical protein KIT62_07265 [Cyclobacteriaceae bacterium]|nr:hypothetical protein [Cyclobacteriaceae bacterium]
MAEILIAKFKTKREADAVSKLIKERKRTAQLMRGNSIEDIVLGELITEGMKGKSYPIKTFNKALNAQIKALKK